MLLRNFYEIYRKIGSTVNLKNVKGTTITEKNIYYTNSSYENGVSYKFILNTSVHNTNINYGYNQFGCAYGIVDNGNPESITGFSMMGMHLIGVGTGDTPVTYEDYKLDNIIALPQSNYNIVNITDENGEEIGLSFKLVCNNTTGSDVTIKEIGVYSGCSTKTSNGIPFLVMREVLNTPVTVPNGSSAVISFNIM